MSDEVGSTKTPAPDDHLGSVLTENQSKFKTCGQIGFYRRQKDFHPDRSPYVAQLNTLNTENGVVTLNLTHQETQVPLKLQIFAVEGNILRLKINEESSVKPRFEVPDVLVKEPTTEQLKVSNLETGSLVLEQPSSSWKIHLTANPFSLLVTQEDKELISVNAQGQLYFENAVLPSKESGLTETDPANKPSASKEHFGLWKEKCEDYLDLKDPSSVGLDFTLHGFENVYGLPEHADTHQLQNTGESEAYRLYNLDVFGYRIHDKMGTYGSVPLLLAHKLSHTCGILWLNASETLVEVHSKAALKPQMHLPSPDMQKQRVVPNTDIRWMSESGVVDVFLLLGPAPHDIFKQYAQLTGTQMFPPLFSLGYHQCRWNYEDEADVEAVDSGFDEHDIPYDVIWLDIEHTDGKRYFTWDKEKFPNPVKMQENLREKRRKLVVISDPHIKVDPKYKLYAEAKEKGYFVKTINGRDFEGSCWPGAVWTGDNKAEWEYLQISVPMLLTLSVTGISFCGADVGGFVGDPDAELLVRWYQAGSFQPFFRAHAMQGTRRREPWLFGEDNTSIIRRVIKERYTLLPFWYLLFYRAYLFAEPVMRPLWVVFPKDPDVFGIDKEYMLGDALLIAPVLDPGVTSLDVLFPGHGEHWYDFRKFNPISSSHRQKVDVTLKEIPVYQRGGSIIPMHTMTGRSTGWMDESPYELRIALDRKGAAVGEVYLDDGHSFQYLHQHMFCYRRFTFTKNVLYSSSADKAGCYPVRSALENVHIMGFKKSPSEVIVHQPGGGKRKLNYSYNKVLCVLSLENLSLDISVDWEIHIK
ncbi:hypothetical protein GDO81_015038 [Engystomops pustulosus]|uniref:Glycoside hydrolase family 31 N-terminal domain-containing protein n=1 Tax=Engystomops pustulosus TaxID=76066 RepID=A0AAV7AGD2_ENGPU|nr:hypothetical protein GDO81_015038 [Engystomops pustulosus]KAG8560582.1 hypothetical protein GDO81_015038 [Engystomops pustulosus]